MSKEMTYEESIHKMLEQVLKNQVEIMRWDYVRSLHKPVIKQTIALLEQVQE